MVITSDTWSLLAARFHLWRLHLHHMSSVPDWWIFWSLYRRSVSYGRTSQVSCPCIDWTMVPCMACWLFTRASDRPPKRVREMVGLSFEGPTYWCHGWTCAEAVPEGWSVLTPVKLVTLTMSALIWNSRNRCSGRSAKKLFKIYLGSWKRSYEIIKDFTINPEIHARSLANFYCPYDHRHMNLKFMRRVSEREPAIRQFVIVKNKLMSVFNASVLLLITDEFRHNIVKVVCGSTRQMWWRNSWSITGQTHKKLTSIC